MFIKESKSKKADSITKLKESSHWTAYRLLTVVDLQKLRHTLGPQ